MSTFVDLLNGNVNTNEYDSTHEVTTDFDESNVDSLEGSIASRRKQSFQPNGDIVLISAWLNTSMDPIEGNQQKADKFWERIAKDYYDHKPVESDRSQDSLRKRWGNIQTEVNKFCGYLAQIQNLNQSGINEQDKISLQLVTKALSMYQDIQKKQFKLMHAWNVLRNHPKWNLETSTKKANKNRKASPSSSSSSTLNCVNLDEDDVVTKAKLPRPSGRKWNKDKLKSGTTSENMRSIELMEQYQLNKVEAEQRRIEKFDATHVEQRQYYERQEIFNNKMLQVQEEKMKFKKRKEDMEIMNIDTSAMPEQQAMFYENLQRQIVADQSK